MPAPTAARTVPLARLTVGGRAVGLVMDRVAGVERADRLRPAADAVTLTAIGREWPVHRLADRLGEPAPPTGGQIVLLDTPAGGVGVLVDRVSPVFRLPAADIRPLPPGFGRREHAVYTSVAMPSDGPLPILSPDAVRTTPHESDDTPPGAAFRAPAAAGDRLLAFDLLADPRTGRPLGFGVPAGWVTEVADAGGLVPVPGSSPHVLGVFAWRGRPVAVLDLGAWAGRGSAGTPRSVVVVPTAGGPIALAGGRGVRMLDRAAPHVPTRRDWPLDRRRVLGCVDFDGLSVALPDFAALVG